MNIIVRDITDQPLWDNFVTKHDEANFLHSWQWGEFQATRGRTILRRGVYIDNELIGVYTGHIEPARRGKHIEIAGGPIIDWQNISAIEALFADIKQQAKLEKVVFVRIRPQLEDSSDNRAVFAKLGLKKAPMYLSVELAGVLDISKPEDEILAGMRQSLRRTIRKAQKNNIDIETSTDPADIGKFYDIQLATAKRHNFVAFSKSFLEKQFAAFANNKNAVLYTAKHDGEILAQNFMIFYGNEASYHYGVSTELGTKLSSAPLLHLRAMADARERGIKRYNFWGIVEEDDTKHRFYGVSVFKRGFGVSELHYLPAHDIIINKLRYQKTRLIETARRKHRHV